MRLAIVRARFSGTVDQAICEELWRASPNPEAV